MIEKNENITSNMIQIMDELHRYVPTIEEVVAIETEEENIETCEKNVHPIIFGGDQLTVARARSAQTCRSSELDTVKRLEGLVPAFEDWHARMTLIKVQGIKWNMCFK